MPYSGLNCLKLNDQHCAGFIKFTCPSHHGNINAANVDMEITKLKEEFWIILLYFI